jgi:hypothetical protein
LTGPRRIAYLTAMHQPALSLLGRAGLVAALALAGCGTGDGAAPIDAPRGVDAATTDAPPAPPVELDGFTATAADAVCAALFRCCDDDLVAYFAPFRTDERLAAFADRLPPTAALDEAGCRAVLREIYDVAPFGDWVAAAQRGEVAYLPAAAGACVAELGAAACGAPARAALYDSTCFAYAAPSGGAEQRRMFARSRTTGAACAPIRDGLGGVFYGSCDPTQAFCCYSVAGSAGCQFPFAADGAVRPGPPASRSPPSARRARPGCRCSCARPGRLRLGHRPVPRRGRHAADRRRDLRRRQLQLARRVPGVVVRRPRQQAL